jgi:hypothetical protein
MIKATMLDSVTPENPISILKEYTLFQNQTS